MDTAKKANAIVKSAIELMTQEEDIKRFENIPEIFKNACEATNGYAPSEALLKVYMVSMANNAVFLLWRRGLLTEELEAKFRALPSTEEAGEDYNNFELELNKEAEALENSRQEFMNKQHDIDIFKAVLNGMPKKEAEDKYEKMQQQIANAVK